MGLNTDQKAFSVDKLFEIMSQLDIVDIDLEFIYLILASNDCTDYFNSILTAQYGTK